MSEKFSYTTKETDRTILVSRSNGEISPMRVSDTLSLQGFPIVYDESGYKPIYRPEAFSDAVQDNLAETLASYPEIERTPEQLKRFGKIDEELAKTAMDSLDIHVGHGDANEILEHGHLRELFQPILRPEVPAYDESMGEPGDMYDHLFLDDESEYQKAHQRLIDVADANKPFEDAQASYDKYITSDTKSISLNFLDRATRIDEGLGKILEENGLDISTSAVDALRENPDVRYLVGAYLLNKLNKLVSDEPHMFGDRLYSNKQKRPDVIVLPVNNVTSREYAAYLALAMIDGSFNGLRGSRDDTIETDKDGRVIHGQHRDAAMKLLTTS